MKKVMLVIMTVLISLSQIWAQEQGKTTTELKAEIAALQSKLADQNANEKQFTSQFIGFGKELGTTMNSFVEAMDGGMKVTTERVNEFAKTDVGRYAIVAIGWKIFATDIISLGQSAFNKTVGFILLLTFCWLLKRTIEIMCWGRMIVTKKEGPWYARNVTKERSTPIIKSDGLDSDVVTTFEVISVIAMVVLFIAACIGLTH